MNEKLSLILFFSVATFFIVLAIVVFLIERHKRTTRDINGVRISIDGLNDATQLEHEKMDEQIKTVARRTQFLVADKISEEVAAEKAKHPPPKGDSES